MFISRLRLNPLHHQAIRDLSNRYELHRSIMRGFSGVPVGELGRVLFRQQETTIFVQSPIEPDWNKLQPGYTNDRAVKKVSFSLRENERLTFQVQCNPVYSLPSGGLKRGKRKTVTGEDAQSAWFLRIAEKNGFTVVRLQISNRGYLPLWKKGVQINHLAVDFLGELEVNDTKKITECIERGIGSAKGFGYGMLCLSRA